MAIKSKKAKGGRRPAVDGGLRLTCRIAFKTTPEQMQQIDDYQSTLPPGNDLSDTMRTIIHKFFHGNVP